jgi:hypothetical protein
MKPANHAGVNPCRIVRLPTKVREGSGYTLTTILLFQIVVYPCEPVSLSLIEGFFGYSH